MRSSKNPQTDSDRWFVQIKEQVIGPIPGSKVLERLLKDEITVNTRVSRDRRSWSAICNTLYFEDLVNYRIRLYSGESQNIGQMRPGGDDASEFEISQVFGLHGATDGISAQLDHARQLEEITANIQRLNSIRKAITLNKKSVTHEKESAENEKHDDDKDVFIPLERKQSSLLKQLVSNMKSAFREQGRHRNRLAMVGAVLITGTAALLAYNYVTNQIEVDNDREKIKKSVAAGVSGDYAKAIENFRGIKNFDVAHAGMPASDIIALADAHIRGRDLKTGQNLLSKAMASTQKPEELARIHELQGMIEFMSGNLSQAAVSFESSLKQKQVFATLHNLAVVKLKQGLFAEAETLFLKALELGKSSDVSPVLMGLFETALRLELKIEPANPPVEKKRITSVVELLQLQLGRSPKFDESIRLALAVGHFHLGNLEAFKLSALELIDQQPRKRDDESTSSGRASDRLETEFAEWRYLYKNCTEIYNRPKPSDFIAAFYAACLRRSHDAQSALPYAKYALAVRPTDPVYIGLFADLLMEQGKPEDARLLLTPNGVPVVGSRLASNALAQLGITPVREVATDPNPELSTPPENTIKESNDEEATVIAEPNGEAIEEFVPIGFETIPLKGSAGTTGAGTADSEASRAPAATPAP